jgi:hypothetical protein
MQILEGAAERERPVPQVIGMTSVLRIALPVPSCFKCA